MGVFLLDLFVVVFVIVASALSVRMLTVDTGASIKR